MARTQLLLAIITPLILLAAAAVFYLLRNAEGKDHVAWRYESGPLRDLCPDPLPNGMVTFSSGDTIHWLRADGSLHASLSRPELAGGFSWAAGPDNLFFFSLDKRSLGMLPDSSQLGPQMLDAVYLCAADTSGQIAWQLAVDGAQDLSWISYSDDSVFAPLPDGRIICAGLNGSLRWIINGDASYNSSVVADSERDRFYYFSSSSDLVARDMQGGELWRRRIGARRLDGPVLAPDGSLRVRADHGIIFSYDREGQQQWAYFPEPSRRVQGLLGEMLWRLRPRPYIQGMPDSTMEVAADGTLYIADSEGAVLAIDSRGELKWRYQTRGGVIGVVTAADGTVYFGSYGDGFYALSPGGRRKWFDGSEKELVSAPRIGTDGKIYIEAYDALVAYNP